MEKKFFPVEIPATEGWKTICIPEMSTGMVQLNGQMDCICNTKLIYYSYNIIHILIIQLNKLVDKFNIFITYYINLFIWLFDSVVSSMKTEAPIFWFPAPGLAQRGVSTNIYEGNNEFPACLLCAKPCSRCWRSSKAQGCSAENGLQWAGEEAGWPGGGAGPRGPAGASLAAACVELLWTRDSFSFVDVSPTCNKLYIFKAEKLGGFWYICTPVKPNN